jgi:hypothetical protein
MARLIDTSSARGAATQMRARILKYHVRQVEVLNKTWQFATTELENQMKTEAPWTDRTTNARNGLFAVVTKKARPDTTAPQDLETVIGHSVPYGIWLETRKLRRARRPIIIPKLKKNDMFRTVIRVFR